MKKARRGAKGASTPLAARTIAAPPEDDYSRWARGVFNRFTDHVRTVWRAQPGLDAMCRLVETVNARIDHNALDVARHAQSVQARTGQKCVVDCARGCSYCCNMPVQAMAPEVYAIARHVATRLSEARQLEIHARVQAHNESTAGLSVEEYHDHRRPCPFLEGDACSVYEARPFMCRLHNSVDVTACVREDLGERVHVPVVHDYHKAAAPTMEGLRTALLAEGLNTDPLRLVPAFGIVVGGGPETLRAYLGGEPVFGTASEAAYNEAMMATEGRRMMRSLRMVG